MIDSYKFGRIVVNGREYTRDVIIYPDRVDDTWWRREGHRLSVDDIRDVIEEKADVLVVGTGYFGIMRVPGEVEELLRSRGIELIAQDTKKACETYNRLLGKGRRVVAALHLTC